MTTDPSTPAPGDPSRAAGDPSAAPGATPSPGAEPAFGPVFGDLPAEPAERASGQGTGLGSAPATTSSSAVARILTVLYALVVTPLATGLIVYGGAPWQQHLVMRLGDLGSLLEMLLSPSGLTALLASAAGLLLLVSVVATGLASSAGLLSVGALSMVPLAFTVMPQLLTPLFEVLPRFLLVATGGLFGQGPALLLYPVLGGLGMALVIARRRPGPHQALSLLGAVVLPLVMLAGTLLIMNGTATAMRSFAQSFGTGPLDVMVLLLLVVGMVLLWLGVAGAGRSPFALVLPAFAVLAYSAVLLAPDLLTMLHTGLIFSPTGSALMMVMVVGTGPAIGLVLLAHTVVQWIVTSRARRRLPIPATATS
ncbi:MAG TPA: hypothetical protein H9837_06865 [Candidatus Brachybacterium merdigallinarum]|nr:hypothetical protein [Candidatus Brachybacterium merdigallinarum]